MGQKIGCQQIVLLNRGTNPSTAAILSATTDIYLFQLSSLCSPSWKAPKFLKIAFLGVFSRNVVFRPFISMFKITLDQLNHRFKYQWPGIPNHNK